MQAAGNTCKVRGAKGEGGVGRAQEPGHEGKGSQPLPGMLSEAEKRRSTWGGEKRATPPLSCFLLVTSTWKLRGKASWGPWLLGTTVGQGKGAGCT